MKKTDTGYVPKRILQVGRSWPRSKKCPWKMIGFDKDEKCWILTGIVVVAGTELVCGVGRESVDVDIILG